MKATFNVYKLDEEDGTLTMETGCSAKADAIRSARYNCDLDARNERHVVRVVVKEEPADPKLATGTVICPRTIITVVRAREVKG